MYLFIYLNISQCPSGVFWESIMRMADMNFLCCVVTQIITTQIEHSKIISQVTRSAHILPARHSWLSDLALAHILTEGGQRGEEREIKHSRVPLHECQLGTRLCA